MKKLLGILGGLVLTLALTTPVFAAQNWDVRGTYTIAFTCTSGCGGTYNHFMNVTVEDMDSGAFSGTGYYINNPAYTWNVTGTVDGDNITFYVDYTGLNPTYYVNVTGTIASNGSMSGTATAPGQTFNWATTSGYAKFNRRAEITSPSVNQVVFGDLTVSAYLMDNDYDPVSWAVRKGTCAAATNTVFGNVDGFHDLHSWTYSGSYKYDFSATADTSTWDTGQYCFIFNPSEDVGESDIRLTEFFFIGRLGSLTPGAAYNPIGTDHTVSTSIGVSVAGVQVLFVVSGPNNQYSSVNTNLSGVVEFTYTGNYPGEDTITACINQNDNNECDLNEPQSTNTATKYWMENFVTGGGNYKEGKTVKWTFSGVVGVLEGYGYVGNFQYINHITKDVCKFDSFSSLVFSRDEATSPVASYNTAIFTGDVTCSSSRPITDVTVTIQDLGEPGAGSDKITISDALPNGTEISGGNFQVHNVK